MKKNKIDKKHKSTDTRLQEKIKKYPGFIIAIVFALIVLALVIVVSPAQSVSSADLDFAKQLYVENQVILDQLQQNILDEMDTTSYTGLDKEYFLSALDDLNWLEEKNQEAFFSFPSQEVPVKVIAFSIFFENISQLNQNFSLDIGLIDYESTILEAQRKEFVFVELISEEDIDYLFEGQESDKQIFFNTITSLEANYFAKEKAFLNGNYSIERKFAEAKKINLFFDESLN